jgi:hypothetical protein
MDAIKLIGLKRLGLEVNEKKKSICCRHYTRMQGRIII